MPLIRYGEAEAIPVHMLKKTYVGLRLTKIRRDVTFQFSSGAIPFRLLNALERCRE
jgi:hypothetical protein